MQCRWSAPICFFCTLNKTIALNSGIAGSLKRRGNLLVLKLSADSIEAKHLMQQLGQFSAPVTIIYGPKNPSGIVTADYLHTLNTDAYLKSVQ